MDTNYSLIISSLETFIRKYYVNLLIRGAIWFAATLCCLFLLTTLAAYFAYLSVLSRSLIFYTSILLVLSLGWQLLGRHFFSLLRLGKRIDHKTASLLIGEHFPLIKDKLLNTLQLQEISKQGDENSALIQAGIAQKTQELSPVPFSQAIDISQNLRYVRYVFIPLSIIILLLLIFPVVIRVGTTRMFHPARTYLQPALFSFNVQNPTLGVVQGSSFTLRIKTTGTVNPEEMFIADGGSMIPMEKTSRNSFRYEFINMQTSHQLHLYASGIYSAPIILTVIPKAELLNIQVHLEYPAYIKRHAETLINSGDLLVPEGTMATWLCKTRNTSVIKFTLNGAQSLIGVNSSHEMQVNRKLTASGRYSILPLDQHASSADTLSYQVQVIPDRNPEISVIKLADSSAFRSLSFTGRIHDDYGLRSLSFVYGNCNLAGQITGPSHRISIRLNSLLTTQPFFYNWTPEASAGEAGAKVGGYFEVGDNDGIHGSKTTKTPIFYLVFPSADSVIREAKSNDLAILSQLKQAQHDATEIQAEANHLHDKIATQKEFDYDDRKEAERIIDRQQSLNQRLRELEKMTEKNSALNPLTTKDPLLAEKEKQINNLFKNLIDPKTQDMLNKLQQLIQEKNKNNAAESLQKLEADNKGTEKELDRMKSLYKKLVFEQKLERQADLLAALAQKQNKLASAPAANNKLNQARQEAIKQAFNKIQGELEELQKDKPEEANFSNTAGEEKKASQSLQNASDKLAQNKPQQAAKSQNEAAKEMKNMADSLSQMQEQDGMQEMTKDLGSIRMILQNLLRVSFNQEALMQKLRSVSANDPLYTNLVQQQFDLREDLGLIRDSVYSLSKKVPQIESFVNRELALINTNLESTIQLLGDRRQYEAAARQQFIMTSVNNLAVLLSNTEEQMARAMRNAKGKKGGKSNSPSLSQLGKLQGQLNEEMQQKLGAGRISPGNMSEEVAKMAARQQAIREAFERLNKEDGSLNKSLNQALKKMDESETDLLNKRLNTTLLNRQREIMSRLLEADKAGREQKQDNKREAKRGKDLPPAQIAELNRIQLDKTQEQELIKTILPDLNSFYKTRINSYFKTLNEGK